MIESSLKDGGEGEREVKSTDNTAQKAWMAAVTKPHTRTHTYPHTIQVLQVFAFKKMIKIHPPCNDEKTCRHSS